MVAPPLSRTVRARRRMTRVCDRATMLLHARSYDPKFDRLYDLSGNGLHARLGSAVGADSNDPLRLQYSGFKDVYFPGSASNNITAPDSAGLSQTGTFAIAVEVAPVDYTPAARQVLLGKWTSGQRSYLFSLRDTGVLAFALSADGTNAAVDVNSTAVTGLTDGSYKWLGVYRNGTTGDVMFFTSNDGENWTQLGTTVSASSAAAFDGTGVVEIGSQTSGTENNFNGRVRRARIYSDQFTTQVASFEASGLVEPYASYTDAQANVWTLNRSSTGRKLAVVDRDLFLLGTDDYFETDDHPLLDMGANQQFTAVGLFRLYGATSGYLVAKNPNTVNAWGAPIQASNALRALLDTGGSTVTSDTAASAWSNGVVFLGGMVRDSAGIYATVNGLVNSTKAAAQGDTNNAVGFRIGARTGGAYLDGEFIAAAIFREALSAADLVRLKQELLAL